MLTLLECMKNNLPSNDSSKFKTTESHMDWEKVAFKDFSGDMCKLKWVEISNEVTASHRVSIHFCMCFLSRGNGDSKPVTLDRRCSSVLQLALIYAFREEVLPHTVFWVALDA